MDYKTQKDRVLDFKEFTVNCFIYIARSCYTWTIGSMMKPKQMQANRVMSIVSV